MSNTPEVDVHQLPIAAAATATALVSDEKLVQVYVKIRDAIKEISAENAKRLEKIVAQQELVANELLQRMNQRGNEGFKTEYGTVYRAETVRCSVASEETLFDWIKEHDAFDMLERRVKSTAVQAYIKEHGITPPGVNVFREFSARVRVSTK